ncbi:MAG TPA: phosphopantetheine-binding protein [Streptosporangiaceae bacterium]|nr:phosphopantetheine-binding protein [Streptosporangiaceae bacterium]
MEQETGTAELDAGLRQQVMDCIDMLLTRVLGHEAPAVSDGTRLMEELGLRSATMLELLLELEEELSIQIDVEDIDQDDMTTVGDLADFIAGHALSDI